MVTLWEGPITSHMEELWKENQSDVCVPVRSCKNTRVECGRQILTQVCVKYGDIIKNRTHSNCSHERRHRPAPGQSDQHAGALQVDVCVYGVHSNDFCRAFEPSFPRQHCKGTNMPPLWLDITPEIGPSYFCFDLLYRVGGGTVLWFDFNSRLGSLLTQVASLF